MINSEPKYCYKSVDGFSEIFEQNYADVTIDKFKLLKKDKRESKCNYKILILTLGVIVICGGIGTLIWQSLQLRDVWNSGKKSTLEKTQSLDSIEKNFTDLNQLNLSTNPKISENGEVDRKKRNISNETDIQSTSDSNLSNLLFTMIDYNKKFSATLQTFVTKFSQHFGSKTDQQTETEKLIKNENESKLNYVNDNQIEKMDASTNKIPNNLKPHNSQSVSNNLKTEDISSVKTTQETHSNNKSINRSETLNSQITSKENPSSSISTVIDSEIPKPISERSTDLFIEKDNENQQTEASLLKLSNEKIIPSSIENINKASNVKNSTLLYEKETEESTETTESATAEIMVVNGINSAALEKQNQVKYSKENITKSDKYPEKRETDNSQTKLTLFCYNDVNKQSPKVMNATKLFANMHPPIYMAHSLSTHKLYKHYHDNNIHSYDMKNSNISHVLNNSNLTMPYCAYIPIKSNKSKAVIDVPPNLFQFNGCEAGKVSCVTIHQCIEEKGWCNGFIECDDASDESDCSCKERMDKRKTCDGYFDCPNGEDEEGCFGCSENSFSCHISNRMRPQPVCVHINKRCDGINDCPNRADEENCEVLSDTLYSEDTFLVSQIRGYLHRNWRGRWYPVCNDENFQLSKKACETELGEIFKGDVQTFKKSFSNYGGRFISHEENRYQLINECKELTYAICPHENCGSRIKSEMTDDYDAYVSRKKKSFESDFSFNSTLFNKTVIKRSEEQTELSEIRVVGGKPSKPGHWPWIVAIYKNGIFHCGGMILDESWILTAAHCVQNFEENYFEIQAGILRRLSFSPMEQIRKVSHVIMHKHYDHTVMKNDIALMKLESSLQFNRWIRPICLPEGRPPWGPPNDTLCTAVGWGATKEHGYDPDHMREVNVKILPTCPHEEDREGKEICAGFERGGFDTCQGDSGGPLLCKIPHTLDRWYVAGIVSHGEGCARPHEPGVYTRTALYLHWIMEHTDDKFLSDGRTPVVHCPGMNCKSDGRCISKKRICDKVIDCLEAEDELNCDNWLVQSKKLPNLNFRSGENNINNYSVGGNNVTESKLDIFSLSDLKSLKSKSIYIPKLSQNISTVPTLINETAPILQLPQNNSNVKIYEDYEIFICQIIKQNIPLFWFCDGKLDCEDGTDEINCTCMDLIWSHDLSLKCNGVIDCYDEMDEKGCTNCTTDEFSCYQSSKCINKSLNCDGKPDCPLGEDEENCYALLNERNMKFDVLGKPKFSHTGMVMQNKNGIWNPMSEILQNYQNICQSMGFTDQENFVKIKLRTDSGDFISAIELKCNPARINEIVILPWRVHIYINGEHRCIGILIKNMWVVADSNCYHKYEFNLEADYMLAILGGNTSLRNLVRSYEEQISVIDYVYHDNKTNITLLHLNKPINDSAQVKSLREVLWTHIPSKHVNCVLLAGLNPIETIYFQPSNDNCIVGKFCFKPLNKTKLCHLKTREMAFTPVICFSLTKDWYVAASIRSELETFCSTEETVLELKPWDQPISKNIKPLTTSSCSNDFRCDLGKCIPFSMVCDGKPDCRDNEDEHDIQCKAKKTFCMLKPFECSCKIHEFKCQSKSKCIPKSKFCDGKNDCGDNSDEPLQCSNFTCAAYLNITNPAKLCDSHSDCGDKSDEDFYNCPSLCNSASHFACKSGLCIPLDFVCDGASDCPNHEDEDGCRKLVKEEHSNKLKLLDNQHGVWRDFCISTHEYTNLNINGVANTLGCKTMKSYETIPGVKFESPEYLTVFLNEKQFQIKSKTHNHPNMTLPCVYLYLNCE